MKELWIEIPDRPIWDDTDMTDSVDITTFQPNSPLSLSAISIRFFSKAFLALESRLLVSDIVVLCNHVKFFEEHNSLFSNIYDLTNEMKLICNVCWYPIFQSKQLSSFLFLCTKFR